MSRLCGDRKWAGQVGFANTLFAGSTFINSPQSLRLFHLALGVEIVNGERFVGLVVPTSKNTTEKRAPVDI